METVTSIAGQAGWLNSNVGGVPSQAGVMGPVMENTLDWNSILADGLNMGQAAFSMFAGNHDARSSITQSNIQARALEMSAQEQMLLAKQEELRGKQDANNIMDQMIQTIATQRLASAANGVDIGFGTPVSTVESTRNLADLQLGITREDTLIRSLARRRQAMSLQEEAINTRAAGSDRASTSRILGYGNAFASVSEKLLREKNRG